MGPRELLRPPPHRGPLIAAGAVPLTVGLALTDLRLQDSLARGLLAAILLVPGALIYWLGAQAPTEDGRPPAYQSVLLVTGLLLLYGGVGRAVRASPGGLALASLVTAALALWPALERVSALCLLIAAGLIGLTLAFGLSAVVQPG